MKSLCGLKCELLSDIDLFGKEPEFYFKGKPKKSSWVGIILTIIYITVYIAFLIYKIIRMLKRVDVTFYDTYSYRDFPSIRLTKENFYGAFWMGYRIDETLYYPKVEFKSGKRIDESFNWTTVELDVERCKLENFGSKYQDIFKKHSLNEFYCIKNKVDFDLEGYANLDAYSYFSIKFYPCKDTTRDGEPCKPRAYIEEFFRYNIIELKMQDILLAPEVYSAPAEPTEKDINCPIFKDLYQHIYSYVQITILETDLDLIGFDLFSETKVEKYVKYEESFIVSEPPSQVNIIDSGGEVCEVILQLSAKVLTQRRKYVKLIDVLGDVGGLMEIILSLFKIVSMFLTDLLYEKSIINHLFSFDLEKKAIIIKDKSSKIKKENDIFNYNSLANDYIKGNYIISSTKLSQNKDKLSRSIRIVNEDKIINNKRKDESNIPIYKDSKLSTRRELKRKHTPPISSKNENSNKKIPKIKIEELYNNNNNINSNSNEDYYRNNTNELKKDTNYEKEKTQSTLQLKFDKIKINKCYIYCCFCCLRKRNNLRNALMDEGMKIIVEKLDIMNIFNRIYKDEKIQERMNFEDIEMSDECKQKIEKVYKHLNMNFLSL